MKRNQIPRSTRLKNRISKLEYRLYDDAWGRFGKGNPYRRCKGCDRAEPQISYDGHGWGCWVKGIINEIKHYKKLYEEEIANEKTNTAGNSESTTK
jgi:hypothetical protein